MIFETNLRPAIFCVVPSFFALSGFLVARSLMRVNNIPVFLTLRALRIFPALCCEVIISAFLIGLVLTNLTSFEYLSSHELHNYMMNIIGFVHFTLPGVFTYNPFNSVNQQLWTIPAELECYLLLAFLAVSRVTTSSNLFGLTAVALTLMSILRDWFRSGIATGFLPTSSFIVMCFVWGVFLLSKSRDNSLQCSPVRSICHRCFVSAAMELPFRSSSGLLHHDVFDTHFYCLCNCVLRSY